MYPIQSILGTEIKTLCINITINNRFSQNICWYSSPGTRFLVPVILNTQTLSYILVLLTKLVFIQHGFQETLLALVYVNHVETNGLECQAINFTFTNQHRFDTYSNNMVTISFHLAGMRNSISFSIVFARVQTLTSKICDVIKKWCQHNLYGISYTGFINC